MTSITFSGISWATLLSSATYNSANVSEYTISYWVGSDEVQFNRWADAVEAKGVSSNAIEATDTARFSYYMLSIKMDGPTNEGDGVVMASTKA